MNEKTSKSENDLRNELINVYQALQTSNKHDKLNNILNNVVNDSTYKIKNKDVFLFDIVSKDYDKLGEILRKMKLLRNNKNFVYVRLYVYSFTYSSKQSF